MRTHRSVRPSHQSARDGRARVNRAGRVSHLLREGTKRKGDETKRGKVYPVYAVQLHVKRSRTAAGRGAPARATRFVFRPFLPPSPPLCLSFFLSRAGIHSSEPGVRAIPCAASPLPARLPATKYLIKSKQSGASRRASIAEGSNRVEASLDVAAH